MNNTTPFKLITGLFGSVLSYFQPIWFLFLIAFMALIADCYTAYRLSNRVKKTTGSSTGKFRSSKGRNIFETMMKVSYLIIFGFFVDKYLFLSTDFITVKTIVGAFSFIQLWSVLENESSGNDKKWARLLQKIMVDKTSRHFDIDLSELTKTENTNA